MAIIKNDNDLALQANSIRITETISGATLDISGFTGFNKDALNVYTPTSTTLTALTNVTNPTYIWTVDGADRTPSSTDTFSITPLTTATQVSSTITVVPSGGPTLRLSIYGDSLSANTPTTASELTSITNGLLTVDNYAVGGTTSEDARLGNSPFVSPYISFANQMSVRDTAEYVLIRYGINDSSSTVGISQAQFRSNLNEFITQARAAGKTPILINIILMPVTYTVPQWRIDLCTTYNAIIEDVATLASVDLVDLRSRVTNYPASRVSGDGIHPSEEASVEMDEILAEMLLELLAPTYSISKSITMPITTNGAVGTTGSAGAGTYVIERLTTSGIAPSDAEVIAVIGRTPVVGDLATVSYNSRTAANIYKCDSVSPSVWVPFVTYMPGSLIVENTVAASKFTSSNTGTNLTDMQFALGQTASDLGLGSIGSYSAAGAFSTSSTSKFGILAANYSVTDGGIAVTAVTTDTGGSGAATIGIGNWNKTSGYFKHIGLLGTGTAGGVFRGRSIQLGPLGLFDTTVELGTANYAINIVKGGIHSDVDLGITVGSATVGFTTLGVAPDTTGTLYCGGSTKRWAGIYTVTANISGALTWGSYALTAPAGSTTTYLRNDGTWAAPAGVGTVTSVSGTGTVSGLTLTGTVTGSGNLTLGGAISGFATTGHTHTLDAVTTAGSNSTINASFNNLYVGTFSTVPSIVVTGTIIGIGNSTNAVGLSVSAFRGAGDATESLGAVANRWNQLYLKNSFIWNGNTILAPTGGTTTYLRNDGTWAVPASTIPSLNSVTGVGNSTTTAIQFGASATTYVGNSGTNLDLSNTIAIVPLTGLSPALNNSYYCGGSTLRWSNVYSVLGNFSGNITWGAYSIAAPTGSTTTFLRNDGTWTTPSGAGIGTVTSVSGTGTVSGLTLTGTVTAAGSITLGGAITGFSVTGHTHTLNEVTTAGATTLTAIQFGSVAGTYVGNSSTNLDLCNTVAIVPTVGVSPALTNSYYLGGSTLRWANVYSTLANISSTLTWGGYGVTAPAGVTTTYLRNDGTWAVPPGTASVTSVSGTGTVSGLTLTGTVTSSGSLTLGGAITGFSTTSHTHTLAAITAVGNSTPTAIQFGGSATTYVGNSGTNLDLCATIGVVPSGGIAPALNNLYYLGGSTLRWSNVYSVLGNFSGALTWGSYTILAPLGATTTYLRNDGTWATPPDTVGVTSVSATAPVSSSGGTTPTISMAAATSIANGYMTSTYAAKLDGIAAGATNVTNTNQLTNGAGFVTSSGVTSVSGTGTVSGLTLTGTVTTTGSLTLGGTITGFATSGHTHTYTLNDVVGNGSSSLSNASFNNLYIGTFSSIPSITVTGTIVGMANSTNAVVLSGHDFIGITSTPGTTESLGNATYSWNELYLKNSFIWNGKTISAPTGTTTTYLNNNGQWTTPPDTVGVTSVSATAPVSSSGGTTPTISMAAATSIANGYMTSTYAAKLDGIAAGATNVTNTNQLTNGAGFVTSTHTHTLNSVTATGNNTDQAIQFGSNAALYINKVSATVDFLTLTAAVGIVPGVGGGITPLLDNTYKSGDPLLRWSNMYTTLANISGVITWNGISIAAPTGTTTTYLNNNGQWTTPPDTVGVTSVSATAPVSSSGGTTPTISMAAASSGVNGYMTGTYATKLDGIAAGATNVTNTNQLTNGAGFVTSSGVTSITAGSGLTGGSITSIGTIAINYASNNTWTNGLTIGASTYITSSGDVGFSAGGATYGFASAGLAPTTDGSKYLGGPSNRWNTVFASTGTINTSDERLKEQITSAIAPELRAWAKVNFVKYKFKDVVLDKGTGARWHFGIIAQQVKEAFESEGLDPFEYGILCYDEWEAEEAKYSAEGVETSPAKLAGSRYGIRYEEALILECAYLRSKL